MSKYEGLRLVKQSAKDAFGWDRDIYKVLVNDIGTGWLYQGEFFGGKNVIGKSKWAFAETRDVSNLFYGNENAFDTIDQAKDWILKEYGVKMGLYEEDEKMQAVKNKKDTAECDNQYRTIIENQQDTDLLGNPKEAWMYDGFGSFHKSLTAEWDKEKTSWIRYFFNGVEIAFYNANEDSNLVTIRQYYNESIKSAVNSGAFLKAINEGRMIARDAKKIIERAYLAVPSEIIKLAEAEPNPLVVLAYHGSQNPDLQFRENSVAYFTPDKDLAISFADRTFMDENLLPGEIPTLYTARLDIENLKVFTSEEDYEKYFQDTSAWQSVRDDCYTAMAYYPQDGGDIYYAIFDPSQINIRKKENLSKNVDVSADVPTQIQPGEKNKKIQSKNDENIIWYHGGNSIDKLNDDRPIFFTNNLESAQWYANKRGEASNHILSANLKVKNPFEILNENDALNFVSLVRRAGFDIAIEKDEYGWRIPDKYSEPIRENSDYDGSNLNDWIYVPGIKEQLIKEGYDGLYAYDVFENYEIKIMVPFKKTQITEIKSDTEMTVSQNNAEKSILNQDKDLKGNKKENVMQTLGQLTNFFLDLQRNDIKGSIKTLQLQEAGDTARVTEMSRKIGGIAKFGSVKSKIKELKFKLKAIDEKEAKDKYYEKIAYWQIEEAVTDGSYKKWVEEGRLTAKDAKTIIESAGLKVPQDIVDIAKEPISEPTKTIPTSEDGLYQIYEVQVKNKNGGIDNYFGVPSPLNKGLRGFGDDLVNTLEQAVKASEYNRFQETEIAKRNSEREQQQRKYEEEAQAKKEANKGKTNLEIMTEARNKKTLETQVRYSDGVRTRKENVEKIINDGGYTKTKEVNKIKELSRTAFNRMDGRQQEAHEKRVKEAGTKTEYRLFSKDGSFYDVTKAEYDYAQEYKSMLENPVSSEVISDEVSESVQTQPESEPAEIKTDIPEADEYAFERKAVDAETRDYLMNQYADEMIKNQLKPDKDGRPAMYWMPDEQRKEAIQQNRMAFYNAAGKLFDNIDNKDTEKLMSLLSNTLNKTSRKYFTTYTGVPLGTTIKSTTEAIAQFVGKDNFDSYLKQQDLKRNASAQKFENDKIEREMNHDLSGRMKFEDKIVTYKEFIDTIIGRGYTKFVKTNDARPKHYLMLNNGENRGYLFKEKGLITYIERETTPAALLKREIYKLKMAIGFQSMSQGGLVKGKKHSECDSSGCGERFHLSGSNREVELEDGEVVIKADAVDSEDKFEFEGKSMTPKQILHEINTAYGGKPIL